MQALITFFLKFLLAPILVISTVFLMSYIGKGKAVLKMKGLIIFILIASLILTLPAILGLLKYEFVWGGVIISIISYSLLGFLFNSFTKTAYYTKNILEKKEKTTDTITLLIAFVITILSAWLYYLSFTWLSKLNYGIIAMSLELWFLIPVLYNISKQKYVAVPAVFYDSCVVQNIEQRQEFWNTVDIYKVIQVTLKVRRTRGDVNYAVFSVKFPKEVTLEEWFSRFIHDQKVNYN